MTKQQAFELAEKELPIHAYVPHINKRSIEIYAAALAEWTYYNWDMTEADQDGKIWTNIYRDDEGEPKYFTTAELLTEFEKIAP